MNVCPTCGYKAIRNDFYERHLKTHDQEVKTEEPKTEDAPVVEVDPRIKLVFNRKVEIFINSVPYVGEEVIAPNIELAAEIVRIAREAYGMNVLKEV